MGGDHPKLPFAEIQFRDDRAARLAARELHPQSPVGDRRSAHEERIAVPAMAVRNVRLHQKLHSGLTLDGGRIEDPAAAAETTIDLLKGDEVGAELADDPDDSIGPGLAVEAAALVDVVGRNLHGRPRLDRHHI